MTFIFRINSIFAAAIVLAYTALLANTAPLSRRQTGNVACNIDRLGIVVGLQQTADAVDQLAAQLANTSSSANVSVAQNGTHGAQVAIGQIADAVFADRTADPALRAQVDGNGTLAANALLGIQTNCEAANATLTNALQLLAKANDAGNAVVKDCVA